MRRIFNLIFASIILTSCKAQNADLTLVLEYGKEYKLIIDSKATIIQEINGQKMNMAMTIKGGMSFKVVAINDADYDMDVKYNSLSMSMQLPQGTIEFSSEKKDEQNIFSMLLSKMINNTFNVKMAKNGKIIDVKNLESRIDSMFKDYSYIPEDQLAQIKAQMNKAYGVDAFKGNIEMATAIFPDKVVAKGEEWIIKTKLESGMAADMTTTYTLTEINKDYYLIKGNSKIVTADKDAYIESNGMPMRFDWTGTMISEIKVDKNSGWIILAKINQEISGDSYIKENPQMPNGMKVPMKMINEMTIANN